MKDMMERSEAVKRHYAASPFDFDNIRREIFKRSLTYEVLQHDDLTNKQIVDIGCSTSYLGEYIKTHYPGYQYLGIDLNPKAVEAARAKGLNVREGDNLSLDLPDAYADLTVSEGVIHHTPDPFRCFEELIRITKKKGLISLYVYNRDHIYCLIYRTSVVVRKLYGSPVGRILLEKVVFPIFHLFYVQLGHRLYFKTGGNVPKEIGRNIFHDQILTPIAHFFTRDQIVDFSEHHGLVLLKEKLSINKQGLMFLFEKSE